MSTALSGPQHQLTAPTPEQAEIADWRQQLAERLDSYRAKHSEVSAQSSLPSGNAVNSRASRIARAVASRYAAAPKYSDLLLADMQAHEAFLAEQAAIAQEAAKVAEHNATESVPTPSILGTGLASESLSSSIATSPSPHAPVGIAQPPVPVMPHFASRTQEMHLHRAALEPEPTLEELLASAVIEPRSLLPSKLIEFPRELISAHRARPRLPEPPAATQIPALPELEAPQLRIFEVQPETQTEAQATATQLETAAHADLPATPVPTPADTSTKTQVAVTAEPVTGKEPRNSSPNALRNEPQRAPSNRASMQSATVRENSQSSGQPQSSVRVQVPEAAQKAIRSHSALSSRSVAPSLDVAVGPRAKDRPAGPPRNTVAEREPKPSPLRTFKGLEWAAISLDKEPVASRCPAEPSVAQYVPFMVNPASIDRRVMAFAVDFTAVTAGFLGFLVVFAASTPHLPTGLTAAAIAGAVYVSLWVLYQMFFFSLSGATAGMLYAHIALCTFEDQNPTRSALRRRLGAWWLSCLPLGLGFLWCFVDEDNLSWHDRITRMYQRVY